MSTVILLATLLLVVILILVEGFFSGSETGFYVINRIRLRLRAEAQDPDALRLQHLAADPRAFIATTLVGTNLAVFGASALVTRFLAGRVHNPEFLCTVLLSPILFVFAEVVPKNLFRRHADHLMYPAGRYLAVAAAVFRPLVVVLKGVTSFWDVLLGRRPTEGDPLHSRQRLLSLLMTGAEEGLLSRYQHDVASNILAVTAVPVERAMIPMHRVAVIDDPVAAGATGCLQPEARTHGLQATRGTPLRGGAGVIEVLARTGHSRYPVRSADGTIRRVLDATDYLMACRAGRPVDQALSEVIRLPAGMPVPVALERLQAARPPVALVVGPDDRPLGLVTLKDLVEEIVGELGEW